MASLEMTFPSGIGEPTHATSPSKGSRGKRQALIACHECDLLHSVEQLPLNAKAFCTQCGAFLYQNVPNSLDRVLALNLAAFMFFLMANAYPFLSLKLSGNVVENIMLTPALALYQLGMGELGLLVFLTSIFFPFLTIVGMIYLLLPLKFGVKPPDMGLVYRMVKALTPWSLLGVLMLGVLIAIVKLLDLATIIPGISLYCFAALLILTTAANANFDQSVLWTNNRGEKKEVGMTGRTLDESPSAHPELVEGWTEGMVRQAHHEREEQIDKLKLGKNMGTALERGLVSCHTCSFLVPNVKDEDDEHPRCPRCGTTLHSRKSNSIAKTWALVASAVILLIPANVYPVMSVIRFGQGSPDTILSGVVHLIEGGMWPLAMIVFFASIVVPFTKLFVLVFLLRSIENKSQWRFRDRTLLYRVTEVVGAWSMVDIFLVGLLAALVDLGALATIRPGIGASFFAGAVIITMFAAHSFDPRLIWDTREKG